MDGSQGKLWYIRSRSIVLPIFQAKHYHDSFLTESKPSYRLFSRQISPYQAEYQRLISGL
jgi:hypothetical protein